VYVGWGPNFFSQLKRHGREGHEMAIKKMGRVKKMKKKSGKKEGRKQ
jgi:hypothetical protein